jgi:cobalt-zinc-cadmium efflux system outer membrane protein
MRTFSICFSISLTRFVLAGCATTPHSPALMTRTTVTAAPEPTVVQAAYSDAHAQDEEELPAPRTLDKDSASVPDGNSQAIELPDLIGLTLERNPRLAQVSWAVDTARGRAVQAGPYPNPTVNVTGNEISDRTEPGGIWSVYTGQEIVTANKLGLSQAAALQAVDQATLNLVAERYEVFTDVPQAFFEAATLQRRADILADLVKLAGQSVETIKKRRKAKEAAELDEVQLEVDLERYRAELEATQRALPAAYRKLAASVGIEDMSITRLIGDLDTPLPDYDLNQIRLYVLGIHPELRSAQVGVERAQFVLRRATVEPIPNVTVGAGYTYQGQNRSNDWDIGVSVPILVWNKNQGNIFAARAQVSEAVRQVGRCQNDLVNRLATTFSTYAAARKRADRYMTAILPKAQRTYELSREAFQGGRFEYLQVLQAQRAVAEANLELVRSLGEMWRSASEIADLMLEDQWPLAPAAPLPQRK